MASGRDAKKRKVEYYYKDWLEVLHTNERLNKPKKVQRSETQKKRKKRT